MSEPVRIEFEVPVDETPASRCPYCDRPFKSEETKVLHVGNRHANECSEEELSAYESARSDEEYDLISFHLVAATSIFLVYFMFTFIYALIWA